MPITTVFANLTMDSLVQRHMRYVSLHSSDPAARDDTEVSGGQYQRQSFATDPATGGVSVNKDEILFDFLPASTVTHVGLWTDQKGGALIWAGMLRSFKDTGRGKVINEDDSFRLPAGAVEWALGTV